MADVIARTGPVQIDQVQSAYMEMVRQKRLYGGLTL